MPNKKYFTTWELLLLEISFLTINASFLIFDRERGDNANSDFTMLKLMNGRVKKIKNS